MNRVVFFYNYKHPSPHFLADIRVGISDLANKIIDAQLNLNFWETMDNFLV